MHIYKFKNNDSIRTVRSDQLVNSVAINFNFFAISNSAKGNIYICTK